MPAAPAAISKCTAGLGRQQSVTTGWHGCSGLCCTPPVWLAGCRMRAGATITRLTPAGIVLRLQSGAGARLCPSCPWFRTRSRVSNQSWPMSRRAAPSCAPKSAPPASGMSRCNGLIGGACMCCAIVLYLIPKVGGMQSLQGRSLPAVLVVHAHAVRLCCVSSPAWVVSRAYKGVPAFHEAARCTHSITQSCMYSLQTVLRSAAGA